MPGFNIDSSGGIYPFAPGGTVSDPLRSYRWILKTIHIGSEEYNVDGSKYTLLRNYAELQPPSISLETFAVSGLSSDYKFAKKATFEDIDIVFYAYPELQQILEEWVGLVWSADRGLTSNAYKGWVEFSELGSTGSMDDPNNATSKTDNEVGTFVLSNAWPKKLSSSRLSMSTEEIKRLTVTFSYDWYTYDNPQMAFGRIRAMAGEAVQSVANVARSAISSLQSLIS